MRTYHGKIFRKKEHLHRFLASCKTIHWSGKIDDKKLEQDLTQALQMFKKSKQAEEDLFIRLTLWLDTKAKRGNTVILITEKKHPASIYQTGVALRTSPVRRTHTNAAPPQVKTSAYQNSVLASLEPQSGETYEWVFLDQDGFVTEVRIGNLFLIKAGELRTPPVRGILDGVTRRFVIECALQKKISCQEIPLTRHEIYNADEVFLSNTSWEILPVRALDGRRIGKELPGPITQILKTAFRQNVERACRRQISKEH